MISNKLLVAALAVGMSGSVLAAPGKGSGKERPNDKAEKVEEKMVDKWEQKPSERVGDLFRSMALSENKHLEGNIKSLLSEKFPESSVRESDHYFQVSNMLDIVSFGSKSAQPLELKLARNVVASLSLVAGHEGNMSMKKLLAATANSQVDPKYAGKRESIRNFWEQFATETSLRAEALENGTVTAFDIIQEIVKPWPTKEKEEFFAECL